MFRITLILLVLMTLGLFTFEKSKAEDISIGLVEVQLIMRDSLAARSIQEQVESQRSIYESSLLTEENRLRELEQEIIRQRSVLSPEAFAKKKQDFDSQVTAHKRNVRERRRILDQAYGSGVRELQSILAEIIAETAREKNIVLVFPVSQVLFGERTLLLTDLVLSKLDDKLPQVILNFSTN